MKHGFSKLIWGTFLLLAAVFIVVNQFDGFTNFGIGSIIAAILALAFIVQCVAHLRFAPLPIPFAVLYIVFQSTLGLPKITIWTLILASLLAAAGLAVLMPKRRGGWRVEYRHHHREPRARKTQMRTENIDGDNNPTVSVNFGSVSSRLSSNNLETAQLHCNFGALEIYFDQAELSGGRAEASLNCSFGAIVLFIPGHWRVIDRLNCTLGGVDMGKPPAPPLPNAPQLTLTGSVSLGGVEVRFVR
ncbi:MAG: hypothetical protein LBU70_08840 [Chitinispirillales bacterium]|jgi:hypothetical protein|nr:hypothetical protein [Chitinispirillales bacterium]